jgi:hypothetical protein
MSPLDQDKLREVSSMFRHFAFCVVAASLFVGSQTQAVGLETHALQKMPPPQTQMKSHTVGNLRLVVTNWGYFGNGAEYDQIPWSLEFPAQSEQDYLFQGAVWIGAVVNGDTHVSVGADGWFPENEFFPGSSPGDTIIERSNDSLSPYYDPNAVSEQDLISVFTDTVIGPPAPADHVPLEIRVTQQSYCWSSDWIEDFVLVRLAIENIRKDEETLDDMYVAIFLDADVTPVTNSNGCRLYASEDDINGLRRWKHESDSLWAPGSVLYRWDGLNYVPIDVGGTPKYLSPCDNTNIAWIADDDGLHPDTACPGADPALSVAGVRAISLPQERTSYQWWLVSPTWSPHDTTDPSDPPGSPRGDSTKYVFMSGGRIDPDQVCDGLEYPPGRDSIGDNRCLLSFGPHQLAFGETLEVVWAFLGGERFHDGHGWCEWDFADLIMNGNRAYAVYDNPGIDTDGDGYYGDYMVVGGDTLYVAGDGVPDYRECDSPPWNPCDMIVVGAEETSNRALMHGFELSQNYPNPFSSRTIVAFTIPERTHVTLGVFDVCGRLVVAVADERLAAGRHLYDWNGVDDKGNKVPGGVYFCRLGVDGHTQTRKLVLLR